MDVRFISRRQERVAGRDIAGSSLRERVTRAGCTASHWQGHCDVSVMFLPARRLAYGLCTLLSEPFMRTQHASVLSGQRSRHPGRSREPDTNVRALTHAFRATWISTHLAPLSVGSPSRCFPFFLPMHAPDTSTSIRTLTADPPLHPFSPKPPHSRPDNISRSLISARGASWQHSPPIHVRVRPMSISLDEDGG